MKCTIGHFWQMVWQQKAQIVVMCTGMAEASVRMEQYWPPMPGQAADQPLLLAGYCIRLVDQRRMNGFVCREFQISYVSRVRPCLTVTMKRPANSLYLTWASFFTCTGR